MSYNFDLFVKRVRDKEASITFPGQPSRPWEQTHPGNRNFWRGLVKANLDCLVEDGFDFGGLENECELET